MIKQDLFAVDKLILLKTSTAEFFFLFINIIVYRNIWLGNTYSNVLLANVLNIRSLGFDRTPPYNTILLEIWRNMLRKFSKQNL